MEKLFMVMGQQLIMIWNLLAQEQWSPAIATTVVWSFPFDTRARLIPAADAALASRVVWYTGIRIELSGCGPEIIAMHEGGTTAIVSGPNVLRIKRMARASLHPGHALWPELKTFSSAI